MGSANRELTSIVILPKSVTVLKMASQMLNDIPGPLILVFDGKVGEKHVNLLSCWDKLCGVYSLPHYTERGKFFKEILQHSSTPYVALFGGLYNLAEDWDLDAISILSSRMDISAISASLPFVKPMYRTKFGTSGIVWRKAYFVKYVNEYGYVLSRKKLLISQSSKISAQPVKSDKKDWLLYQSWYNLVNSVPVVPTCWDLCSTVVDIVIPVYGCLKETKRCLINTAANSSNLCRVIVVNDGSRQDDKYLQKLCLSVGAKFVQNRSGRGFPSACNKGWRVGSSRFVCFLNSDTIPSPGWILLLISHLLIDPKCGATGPSTSRTSMRQHLNEYSHIRFQMTDEDVAKAGKDVFRKYLGQVQKCELSGFCFVTRRDLLKTFNGFDEGYGLGYGEENQLQSLFRAYGYSTKWIKYSYVHHLGGQSFRRIDTSTRRRLRSVNKKRLRHFKASLKGK